MIIVKTQELVNDLTSFIKKNYSPEVKVTKSKNGNETTFFRKGGKSLCYIEHVDDNYRVVIVIGMTLDDKINSASLNTRIKKMFQEAKQFHDGKWLFFKIKTSQDIEDIKSLLQIKRPF